MRLERGHGEPDVAGELPTLADFGGEQAEPVAREVGLDAGAQFVAFGRRKQSRVKLHDPRVAVHAAERLAIGFAPRAQDESRRLDHRSFRVQAARDCQQAPDHFLGLFVGEVACGIELLRGVCDHHLGLVDGEHVQEHETLAQVILRAGGALRTTGSAHHRDWLALPGVVAIGAGSPIDGILQDARNGVVIFRGGEQDRVRGLDAGLELGDPLRRIGLVVLVV